MSRGLTGAPQTSSPPSLTAVHVRPVRRTGWAAAGPCGRWSCTRKAPSPPAGAAAGAAAPCAQGVPRRHTCGVAGQSRQNGPCKESNPPAQYITKKAQMAGMQNTEETSSTQPSTSKFYQWSVQKQWTWKRPLQKRRRTKSAYSGSTIEAERKCIGTYSLMVERKSRPNRSTSPCSTSDEHSSPTPLPPAASRMRSSSASWGQAAWADGPLAAVNPADRWPGMHSPTTTPAVRWLPPPLPPPPPTTAGS